MPRVKLNEVAKGNIESKAYTPLVTDDYKALVKEANKRIDLDQLDYAKAEIKAKNYIAKSKECNMSMGEDGYWIGNYFYPYSKCCN